MSFIGYNMVMLITDLIPSADMMIALEPDELGIRLLPFMTRMALGGDFQLTTLLQEVTGHPAAPVGSRLAMNHYSQERKAEVEQALREAWAWLQGAALLIPHPRYHQSIMMLSRRAQRLAKVADPRKALTARHMPKDSLHASIREDVWELYYRGKYNTAVFEAMKAVEVAVREAGTLPDSLLGVKLMRAAFAPSPKTGPLTDSTVESGEQVARMELFAGAIGSYKNPHSHRNVDLDDPDEAIEIIMVANHLLRIVDARCTARANA
jgi:uncharacterized protein (TIGR02391 family)